MTYETLLKIDEALTTNQKEKEKAENVQSASSIQPNSGVTYGGAKYKLPKLIIRKFYGEAHKYQEFWDSFKSSVHENTNLSPIDKFNYLQTLIEEPAYSAVAGLSLTEANYQAALELLKKRYGQRRTIINSHIDAIFKIEPLQNSADISQLQTFYDTVEQHCRGLKALDVSYATVLVNVLLRSLPENIKLVISRKMTDSDWTFEKL